jgi:hypothetical protein
VAFFGDLSAENAIFITRQSDNPGGQSSLLVKPGDTIGGITLTGLFSIKSAPAINNHGAVAFVGFFSGGAGAGIFTTRQSDGPGSQSSLLVKTGDTIGGKTLTDFGPAAINNRGTVVFLGLFSGEFGIFNQSGLVAKIGDSIGGQTLTLISSLSPAINNHGTVAFAGEFAGGSGIFTQSSLLAKTGDTIGGKTLTAVSIPAINDSGMVAFVGFFPGASGIFGGSGIFTTRPSDDPGSQSSLLVKTGDTIGGQTLTGFVAPAASNNHGTMAFLGKFAGGSGIFTQSSLVAKPGDVIGGKTLFFPSSNRINDAGAIAFAGTFSDGSQAIILAQPKGRD